jgi:transposase
VLPSHAIPHCADEENRQDTTLAPALILNYYRARKQLSSGVVEGLNNKAKLTMRKSYGFRTFHVTEIALYHALGKLPEPDVAHRFF